MTIQNEDNLTDTEIKSIESMGRRLAKIAKEIKEMGLNITLHDGTLSILKGEPFDKNGDADYDNIKIDVTVGSWGTVDW